MPHKEKFYRKKAPWKTKKTLQGNKLMYNYEDNTLMYTGYNEIPLYNKFEILSDKDQMCTLGNIKTYPDPIGSQHSYQHRPRQTEIMNTPHTRTLVKPRKLFKGNNVDNIDISSIDIDIQPSSLHTETILHTENKISTQRQTEIMNTPCTRTLAKPRNIY